MMNRSEFIELLVRIATKMFTTEKPPGYSAEKADPEDKYKYVKVHMGLELFLEDIVATFYKNEGIEWQ